MRVLSSPIFEQHVTPPGHPERIERAQVFEGVRLRWAEGGGQAMEPRPATRAELERIHEGGYLDEIAATAGRAMMLDPDTLTSPASHEVALLAAGAAIQAAELAVDRREPAFALVRPPGHHAERDRAMGFCLYNNVAAAAAAMLARGLERVAVVDIDVHHGNGTQHIFYRDPRVLYVSTHQYPFWPGTGAAHETGAGEGQGFTVNVPMEAGSQDADYAVVYRAVIGPVLDAFRPQLMLVSAGYDAHERDPLASMRMTTRGYADCMRALSDLAVRHGALAGVTEGGYDLTSLAGCLEASFAAIEGRSSSGSELDDAPIDGSRAAALRGERAAAAALVALKPFWPDI
jgi:acetoin utilization deacetylase AcuC-like enzyme